MFIRNQVFPRRKDVRVEDVVKWLDQLTQARFLVPFTYNGEGYYVSRTFKLHQRIDRPSPSKIPSSIIRRVIDEHSMSPLGTLDPESRVEESRVEENLSAPGGAGEAEASPPDSQTIFKGIEKKKQPLYQFIRDHKPDFIEPYAELWNIFARERKKPQLTRISDARRKKFATRLKEKSFDFLQILTKAGSASDFLSASKWFTWDWIMESEGNYLKVIEGNYDPKDNPAPPTAKVDTSPPAEWKTWQELNYLYERWLEDPMHVTVISIDGLHYNLLKSGGQMNFSTDQVEQIRKLARRHMQDHQLEGPQKETALMKAFGVLELFKKLKTNGATQVYAL